MKRSTLLIVLATLLAGSRAWAADLPNIDAFGERAPSPSRETALRRKAAELAKPGATLQVESRLGVPTFVWTDPSRVATLGRTDAVSAARQTLDAYASLYDLGTADVAGAVVGMVHNTRQGPILVKFRQQVGGIDVFREEVNVMMDRSLRPVGISGYITSRNAPEARSGAKTFALSATAAASRAVRDLTGITVGTGDFAATEARDGYQYYGVPASSGLRLEEPVRTKAVYFHLPEGLEAGYYVEVQARVDSATNASLDGSGGDVAAYSYVISAATGQILYRKNLTSDLGPGGFTYHVWADPATGIPYDEPSGNDVHPKVDATPDGVQYPFVAAQDVTLPNYPFSQNDPWLAPGATETVGNNADAYVDLFNPDGFNPAGTPADPATADFRAQITSADVFGHVHTPDATPALAEARQGAIQQLFYDVNFLHDYFYDAGFDEASGNAQLSNFGRGGAENDRLRAEGQDVSGRNNANMATPADGASPRMQMFLFDSNAIKYVDILSPPAAAGQRTNIGTGQFGAQVFDITQPVVQPSPANGCTAASFTSVGVTGKIVLVDREPTATCSIGTKLNNAMAAGAAGFILVNLSTTPNQAVNVTGSLPSFTIPFMSVTWNDAASIKTALAVPSAVTGRMRRDAGVDRDGTIDNQVIFHEWGHYISNRLIGNAGGLNTNMSGGMGEGWGDTLAMLLTARKNDPDTPSNATWNGAYALATYVTSGGNNNGYYYGIRRYPYSTDMATRNPLTYKHIQDGVALPVGPPVRFGADGASNSEVHSTGEVWATMLWECYAALLRDTQGPTPRLTFEQAQARWKQYLVAAFKMTPINPTFPEARDAVLAAANATDVTDYVLFWNAFAKRGLGVYAVSPDRYTQDNSGTLEESFEIAPEMTLVSTSLDDSVAGCDGDGVLDAGEHGHFTVTLKNVGSTTLSATTATVTSATPGVTIVGDNQISFSATAPLATTAGSVEVALAPGLAGAQAIAFHVTWTDPDLPGPLREADVDVRGNTNSIPASTATDTVEASSTLWTVTSTEPTITSGGITFPVGGIEPWKRQQTTALQHVWHGTDPGIWVDERLTSPVFTVDGSGSFNLQLDHSWGFEFDAGGNYDGGVIEISINGGAFVDFGGPAYNGTILNYGGVNNPNPIKGRSGFVQNSAGTVHTSLTQAVPPGSTVQVRFRIGADGGFGSTGWDLDNLQFSGVVETPFTTIVADTGCSLGTTTTLGSSANPSPAGASLTLTAHVGSAGGPPPSGTVTFLDGGSPIGMGAVTTGTATYSTSALSTGVHSLSARFEGIAGFLPSTSSTLSQTIGANGTTTVVLSSLNPSTLSDSVTFTATVSASAGTPAGSVTFKDGAASLATIALTSGQAQYTTALLGGGSHTIKAEFGGSSSYGASTGTVEQVVERPTINASGPTTVCQPDTVTLTAANVPSGTVSYLWSPGGETTSSIVVASSGSYTVTVTKNGVSGTSDATEVTVNPNPTPVITAPLTAGLGETGLVASVPDTPGHSYSWSVTNGTITAGDGTHQITFTAGTTLGDLDLSVVETCDDGCVSAPGTATVEVINAPFDLYVVTPCRALDTRLTGGPLAAGEHRLVTILGTCGIPLTAKAVSLNLTALGGSLGGRVTIMPADQSGAPIAPAVEFGPGRVRAGNGVVRFAYDGTQLVLVNGSGSSVDVLIDVNGWFE